MCCMRCMKNIESVKRKQSCVKKQVWATYMVYNDFKNQFVLLSDFKYKIYLCAYWLKYIPISQKESKRVLQMGPQKIICNKFLLLTAFWGLLTAGKKLIKKYIFRWVVDVCRVGILKPYIQKAEVFEIRPFSVPEFKWSNHSKTRKIVIFVQHFVGSG